MGIFKHSNWLFSYFKPDSFEPEKNKWYRFSDPITFKHNECDLTEFPERTHFGKFGDRVIIKPFAYINGKKYRAKFYVTDNTCEIEIRKEKFIVPIKKCSFRFKHKVYFKGQSGIDEYYITVLVKDLETKNTSS